MKRSELSEGEERVIHCIKAGRLSNGWELGKGSIVHLARESYPCTMTAICGAEAKIMMVEVDAPVTCKRCLDYQNSNSQLVGKDSDNE